MAVLVGLKKWPTVDELDQLTRTIEFASSGKELHDIYLEVPGQPIELLPQQCDPTLLEEEFIILADNFKK